MTTEEWNEISEIIEEKDFKKLATELAIRTYDLDMSKKELNERMEKSNTETRLWKAQSVCIYKRPIMPSKAKDTDVMELTVDEAVSWYKDWGKHLNDYYCDIFTVYPTGLFYKKDGEWVRYEA